MNAHSVVEDWETAPFEGGFDGLTTLGSRGFDGAVEAAGTWLFLRSGDPIAVVSDLETTPRPGDIDAFEGASGRQYEAPNRVAATVAAMLALDGEVRGRYFTDDTPLSAVHDTLSEGGFTGYVELSENVLSGDYYYVYVDGEVDHVGFVGSSQRLYGEKAQTKAEDEIGIYAVVSVSLPDLELPDPEPEAADETGAAGTGAGGGGGAEAETETGSDDDSSVDDETEDATEPEVTAEPDREEADAESDVTTEAEAEAEAAPEPDDSTPDADDRARTEGSRGIDAPEPAENGAVDATSSVAAAPSEEPTAVSNAADATEHASSESAPSERGGKPAGIGGLATRQVPSLDPEQSGHGESGGADAAGLRSARGRSSESDDRTSNAAATAAERGGANARSEDRERSGRTRESYEERIDEYESRIEELESELVDGEAKIESLEAELEAVRSERDELRSRLEATDTGADGAPAGSASLTVEEALEGTSLFVRERTRGEATLDDGHDGTEDRQAVAENLRIEYHTTFDSTGVTVGGEPFEAWLRSSPPYEFAEWLVTELLFDIRSTDAQEGLGPLYDALPAIDRVGFDEAIEIESGTEGDAEEETARFDIVARDKKGSPLVVAHFDQRREPTRADTIGPFVTACSNVCEATGTLAAGVVVTSSYFEADAMSATEEATSTSLLSRSKHRSYVKLSRGSGFHLCLVEARDDTFNLSVPEL